MIAIHPITLIEITIASSVIFVCFVGSFLLFKKKGKKIGLSIAWGLTIVTVAFFLLRPYWIDEQISKRSQILDDYLIGTYPESSWEITSVDHRTYRQYNPYHLKVTFTDEPLYVYSYFVDRNGMVNQVSVSVPSHTPLEELKYMEMGKEE